MILVIPIVLALVVAWLTFAALRRRARDSGVKVCRNCCYPVTGLLGEYCPECGGAFAVWPPVYAGFAFRARVAAKVGAWVLVFPYFVLALSTIFVAQFATYDWQVSERLLLAQPISGAFDRVAVNCEKVVVSRLNRRTPDEVVSLDWSLEFDGEPKIAVTYDDGVVTLSTSDGRQERHKGDLTSFLLFDWLADVYGSTEPQLRSEAAEIVAFLDAMTDPTQTAPPVMNFQGTGRAYSSGGMPRSTVWGYVILIVAISIWVGGAGNIIRRGARQHSALISEMQMPPS